MEGLGPVARGQMWTRFYKWGNGLGVKVGAYTFTSF